MMGARAAESCSGAERGELRLLQMPPGHAPSAGIT